MRPPVVDVDNAPKSGRSPASPGCAWRTRPSSNAAHSAAYRPALLASGVVVLGHPPMWRKDEWWSRREIVRPQLGASRRWSDGSGVPGFLGRRRGGPDRGTSCPRASTTWVRRSRSCRPAPRPGPNLDRWDFRIQGQVEQGARWSWPEFQALPREDVTVDIHCVTSWSKFDTRWAGVSVDTLLEHVQPTGGVRHRVQRRGVHHQPAAGRPDRREGLGRRHATTGLRSGLITADRPGCWCPTSTSGSPRSGYAG